MDDVSEIVGEKAAAEEGKVEACQEWKAGPKDDRPWSFVPGAWSVLGPWSSVLRVVS
jgi:hypothetical protein